MGDVYTEDLKVLARSDLGQAMLSGMPINTLNDAERAVLQKVLERIVHENGMPQPGDQVTTEV